MEDLGLQMHNQKACTEMGVGREGHEGEKEGGGSRRSKESGLVNNASALA